MKPTDDVETFELSLGADLRQLLLWQVLSNGPTDRLLLVAMVTGEISTRSRCLTVRRST